MKKKSTNRQLGFKKVVLHDVSGDRLEHFRSVDLAIDPHLSTQLHLVQVDAMSQGRKESCFA